MSDNTAPVQAAPDLVERAQFDSRGLIPVVAQDVQSLVVLMVAWMDKEALRRTLAEGRVTYFSRSRQEYWRKGDTSGHVQHAVSARLDCDADVVLLSVTQHGPACHLGTTSCFDEAGTDG
jgi:phosphoribosyl-AMP cyclohydrolase